MSFNFTSSTVAGTANAGYNIDIDMSIPQQYIRLESYSVKNSADTTTKINTDQIYIDISWLNNMSVHTNHATSALPLMVDANANQTIRTGMDYDFNLTDSISKSFNVKLYDSDGAIYNALALSVTMNFVYNRNVLF